MNKYSEAIKCLEKYINANVNVMNHVLQKCRYGTTKKTLDKLMKKHKDLQCAIEYLKGAK